MAKSFIIDQTSREALTKERAEKLLQGLKEGVTSVKLSGKSFGDGSADIAASALERVVPTLKHLDISDIIASRPEEEAKRSLATIAASLNSCKHLEYIDLSDNALGAKGIRAVGSLLSGQEKLQQLFLCNNGLAADAGALITAALLETTPTSLVRLHFHNNLLETAGSVALAPIIENSPLLEDFRFSSLRLGRDGAVTICNAVQPCLAASLRILNFSDNNFGEEGAEALADALSDAPCLETLLLNDALLGDEGVGAVCDSLLHGAPSLKVLNVSGNEVSIEGAKGLAYLLSHTDLSELILEDNELGSSGAARLAKGITRECNLEVLTVNSSEIGSRGALALARAAAKVSSLKVLNLNGNMISAETVTEIEGLLGDRLGSLEDNDDEEEEEDDESGDESGDEDEEEDDGYVNDSSNGVRVEKDDSEIDDLAKEIGEVSL